MKAQASASLEPMPGLISLLTFLRASGIHVGLVTRNTTESLNAFFAGGWVGGWVGTPQWGSKQCVALSLVVG